MIPALPCLTRLVLSHGNNEFGYTVREKIMESTYFSLLVKAHSRWDGAEMRLLQGRKNRVQGNDARGAAAVGNGGAQYRAGNANDGRGKPIKWYNCNGIGHIAKNCIQLKRPQNSDYFKENMLLMQAQENGVDMDDEQLLFLTGYDEVGLSYDSDTLFEVHDHDNCLDNMNESHEEHEMHNVVQPNDIVDSDTEYTIMIITNDIYEWDAQCVPSNMPNDTVNTSLTAELARYKELAKGSNRLQEPLKIAETTRKQMIEKMKDLECVKKKVKIAPHDYSKENYLATFTPQKQLTPEQIFWSDDLMAKALKEKAKSAKPITAMTVYPPNTPAKLVSKVLLTKSQVQAGYLTEVILFFKTIKEHFEAIQKSLINKIKEMKEVFDQMEAEVDQNAVDKKCDEIEKKKLLIENENLIVECLSKDVFYTATDYVLSISRFFDMHDGYTVTQKRIAELEAENTNLKNKIQNDDHDEMIKQFSKLKLQGRGNTIRELKEKISRLQAKHSDADPIIDFKALDSQNKDLTVKVNALQDLNEHFRAENEKVKAALQGTIKGKMTCVTMPVEKTKVLAPGMYAIDVEPISPHNRNNREVHLDYIKHLKESVETLREIIEEARAEKPFDSSLAPACLYTKHSQELLEYVIGTCPKDFNKSDRKIATAPLNRKKRVTFVEPGETLTNNSQTHVEEQKTKKTNKPMIPSTGVKDATAASGSKPRSNIKKDRTLPAKSDKKKVEDHSRNNKSSVKQNNRVDSSISYKRTVINSNSNPVCKTCNKCLMSFNHDKYVVKSLKFVKKPPVNKVWRVKQVKQVWQTTGKLFTNVRF
ncbi:hypothetical protein Tco_0731042 [Tanacetum coccineum]